MRIHATIHERTVRCIFTHVYQAIPQNTVS